MSDTAIVLEDDPPAIVAIDAGLELAGLITHRVKSAADLLELLATIDPMSVRVVIVGLESSERRGVDCLAEIAGRFAWQHVPIFVTTSSPESVIAQALGHAGAVVLVKPINSAAFSHALQQLRQ